MDNNISIKRTVISSFLLSMLVILISIHLVIILIFLNWEIRRIKSEINKTSLIIHRELEVIKHLNQNSTIKLIHERITELDLIQGNQSSLHINLIYKNLFFPGEFNSSNYNYKEKLGTFQFVLNNKSILIMKIDFTV